MNAAAPAVRRQPLQRAMTLPGGRGGSLHRQHTAAAGGGSIAAAAALPVLHTVIDVDERSASSRPMPMPMPPDSSNLIAAFFALSPGASFDAGNGVVMRDSAPSTLHTPPSRARSIGRPTGRGTASFSHMHPRGLGRTSLSAAPSHSFAGNSASGTNKDGQRTGPRDRAGARWRCCGGRNDEDDENDGGGGKATSRRSNSHGGGNLRCAHFRKRMRRLCCKRLSFAFVFSALTTVILIALVAVVWVTGIQSTKTIVREMAETTRDALMESTTQGVSMRFSHALTSLLMLRYSTLGKLPTFASERRISHNNGWLAPVTAVAAVSGDLRALGVFNQRESQRKTCCRTLPPEPNMASRPISRQV